ncbi:MAG: hypothetical protein GX201_01175 [Clostridiales bacterium]|nr:hypothetical protein [Clostridiales bacterium]
MFKHEKQLLQPVRVNRPNPNYAAMLQEQLGGPQGELKAAMQYLSQSFRIKDKEIKDLFLDIASEELSHMEKDWGITKDSKLYFNLSTPGGQYFNLDNPQPPSFENPSPSSHKM